jgi:ComF family protein
MPEIGTEMGKYFGAEISDSVFNEVDVLIPVPLHPNRFKKRGYNQSEKIAEGMAVSLNKSVDSESIVRFVDNQTQTKKNQEERRKNVDSIFQIKNAEMLKNKHILIIDDVITTGSTLISLAEEISKIEGTKISITALGMASN